MTPRQCKAARALLGWSQEDLALRANLGKSTVADYERGHRVLIHNNYAEITELFARSGILIMNHSIEDTRFLRQIEDGGDFAP